MRTLYTNTSQKYILVQNEITVWNYCSHRSYDIRYDADQNKDKKSFKGPGVLICSIDNMPTQLPREATDFFGDLLYPYVTDILKSDANKPFEDNKVRWLIQ